MASLSLSGSSVRSQAIPRFPRPKLTTTLTLSPTSLGFRLKDALRWQAGKTGQRFFVLYASSGGDPVGEKPDGNAKSDANAQGPPFLTIVAGFLLFFLVYWIVRSIVMWLVGLIISLASPK